MNRISTIALALAALLSVSCYTNNGGDNQPKSQADKTGKSEPSFITPVKKPGVKEAQVIKDLEYELAVGNKKNVIVDLPIGHYEVDPKDMEMLAALDANGLITLKSQSIKKSGANDNDDNYSIWVDVALTPTGTKYIEKGQTYSQIINPDKKVYNSIIHPVRDRNAYGELEEEIAKDNVRMLFVNFYNLAVTSSLKNAIKSYGESEFIDTYERAAKISAYLDIVVPGSSLVDDNTFFAGAELNADKIAALKVVNVTRYRDCYKVYLDASHSVVYILDKDHNKIFDVVCKMEDTPRDSQTLRTRNKQWSEEQVKQYAIMAAAPATPVRTEEELGIEREWYAPGLIPVSQKDEARYIYLKEKQYAMSESVPILLYRNVVDKVNKIMVTSIPKIADLGGENEKMLTYVFTATAWAVIKKVDITPFQRVLQQYGAVTPVTEDNVFKTRGVELTYCDERGWFAEFSDGDFFDGQQAENIFNEGFDTPTRLYTKNENDFSRASAEMKRATRRIKEFTNRANAAQSSVEIEALGAEFAGFMEELTKRLPGNESDYYKIDGWEEFVKAMGQFESALVSASHKVVGQWSSIYDDFLNILDKH